MLTKVSHGILPVSPAAATENPKIDSLTQKMLDMANPDLEKAFVDSLFFPEYERREKALSRPSPYQLVTSVLIMQEILMANFLPPDCGVRIPTWPVQILKPILESALNAADDCCFSIFVDGADKFEDFQHVQSREVDATDLVDFLFEIQRPNHVKLRISSRPELRITNVHPSFLVAKLADLNHDDIRTFVDEKMQAMIAIPKSQDRRDLAREITYCADGIFLWAAFAVTQMKKACSPAWWGRPSLRVAKTSQGIVFPSLAQRLSATAG